LRQKNNEWKRLTVEKNNNLNPTTEKGATIEELTIRGKSEMLPQKCKEQYEKEYKKFREWMKSKVISSLKSESKLHKPKQSATITPGELNRFLLEAKEHTMEKLVALIGLNGALRCEEIVKLDFNEVKKLPGESYRIFISSSSKTDQAGIGFNFIVDSQPIPCRNLVSMLDEYIGNVSKDTGENPPTGRFFRQFRNGKYTKQPLGKSFFQRVPKSIALFLGYSDEEANKFTTHWMRRSAASWLANNGASVVQLQKFGRWKNPKMAEHYVDNSDTQKKQLNHLLNSDLSTGQSEESDTPVGNLVIQTNSGMPLTSLFSNCQFGENCKFEIVGFNK